MKDRQTDSPEPKTVGGLLDSFTRGRPGDAWFADPEWPDVEARIISALHRGGWREFVYRSPLLLLVTFYFGRLEFRSGPGIRVRASDLPDAGSILLVEPVQRAGGPA